MDPWEELAGLIAREPESARAEAARVAVRIMRSILRDDWLGGGWVPPELALASLHTVAFAQLLELALRLDEFRGTPGAAVLRQTLRSNRTAERWRHTQLQLEVAALASATGAVVEFETGRKSGWPPDVVVRAGEKMIPVEVFGVFTSDEWRAATRASDEVSERLLALEFHHRLSLVVDLGGANLETDELED